LRWIAGRRRAIRASLQRLRGCLAERRPVHAPPPQAGEAVRGGRRSPRLERRACNPPV